MTGTARLNLPLLSVGQAQKEFAHNEALQSVDALLGAAIEESPRSAPPAAPAVGQCYIVGPSATGEWTGKEDHLTVFTSGGWRFARAFEGLSAYVRDLAVGAQYRAGAWELGMLRATSLIVGGVQVVGSRLGPISAPIGGSTVDVEGRATINQILATMRDHGLIES